MYPSAGERFYMDQQVQVQAQQAAAQAQANAMYAASIAVLISAHGVGSRAYSQSGDGVEYVEQEVDFGDVQIDVGDAPSRLQLPGEFGTALSIVATFSVGDEIDPTPDRRWLWWWFVTSVDGKTWATISSPGITSVSAMQENKATTLRINGPFANRLALGIACRGTNRRATTRSCLVAGAT
jgi:hypothetical protein